MLTRNSSRRSSFVCGALTFLAMVGVGGAAYGQEQALSLTEVLVSPITERALAHLGTQTDATADLLAEIGAIISPSGQEQERAEAVATRMREIGLQDVEVDDNTNAIGRIPGQSGQAVVFIATLDDLVTVAENQRAAASPPRVEGDRVVGPGTNTSSITAAMLVAAESLVQSGFTPEHDLVFAAVAQEETGLIGMRELYEDYREQAVAFVDILGDGQSISYGALGVHWWRVNATGPDGHTMSGGLPNINQGMGRAVDAILQLPHPEREADKRTFINIAQIRSGDVFNHKPAEGWFSLDIRSLDATIISDIEGQVERILQETSEATEVTLEMEPYQLIPGGQLPGAEDSVLVQTAAEIARHLGLEPTLSEAGSSNMNVAIAGGTPAIGLGGERGGERGQPEEWADIPAMMRAAEHVVLLAVSLGGVEAE